MNHMTASTTKSVPGMGDLIMNDKATPLSESIDSMRGLTVFNLHIAFMNMQCQQLATDFGSGLCCCVHK